MASGSVFVLPILNSFNLKAFLMQDDRMTGFLDKGKEKNLTNLYFTKTFGTISHSILINMLDKLENVYGGVTAK